MAECGLGVGFDVRLYQAPPMIWAGDRRRTHATVCARHNCWPAWLRTWKTSSNGAFSTRPRSRFSPVGIIGMVDRSVRRSTGQSMDRPAPHRIQPKAGADEAVPVPGRAAVGAAPAGGLLSGDGGDGQRGGPHHDVRRGYRERLAREFGGRRRHLPPAEPLLHHLHGALPFCVYT